MAAPVLTAFTDMNPCPRVEVFFPSFVAGTTHVTVYRLASGREFPVRGAVMAPTGGTLTRIDFEAPFNVAVSYRAEQFDAAGLSLGFTETGVLGDQYTPWLERARNLFTNPSFESGSGTVEVRRNLAVYPRMISTTGWTLRGTEFTITPGAQGIQFDATAVCAAGNNLAYAAAEIATSVGQDRSSAMVVEVPAGYPALTFTLLTQSYGGSAVLGTTTVTVNPGQVVQISAVSTQSAPTGATGVRPMLRAAADIPSGARFYVRNALVEATRAPGATFNPGIASPDSDLTASWVGAVDSSASILTGVPASGVTSPYSGARGFQSSQWAAFSAKSLRVRSIGAAAGAAVAIPFALTAGKTYTLITKARIASPLTGTDEALSRRIRIGSPSIGFVASDPAPNVVGEHEIRWTVTPTGAYDTVQLWHGGAVGSPDIWYDGLMVVEGAYAGPYLDGATVSATPGTERYRWVGPANASESVYENRSFLGIGLMSSESWMHNPLDPQGSARVVFGEDAAWTLTRPTPGVVSRPKGRRVGVVLSEPRQGITGMQVTLRTSSTVEADKVQAMFGDDGRPPVVCIRLGGDDQRLRVPQPLFLSTLIADELDMDTRWGGSELAHRVNGDEVDPPIPGLFVPLLTRADLNAFFATRAAMNAGGLTRSDLNRRYDLAGTAG